MGTPDEQVERDAPGSSCCLASWAHDFRRTPPRPRRPRDPDTTLVVELECGHHVAVIRRFAWPRMAIGYGATTAEAEAMRDFNLASKLLTRQAELEEDERGGS